MPARTELPDGWDIRIRRVSNVYTLTLRDRRGSDCEIGFLGGAAPHGPQEITARRIRDLPDARLRRRARDLVETYMDRVATAQANVDGFIAAVPDADQLTDHLHAGGGLRLDTTVDPDSLTVVAHLTAAEQHTDALRALVTAWMAAARIDPANPGTGLTLQLDQPTPTVELGQARLIDFLRWYRPRTTGKPAAATGCATP